MKTLDCDTSSESEEGADVAISRVSHETAWSRVAATNAAPSSWGWHSAPVSVIDTCFCRVIVCMCVCIVYLSMYHLFHIALLVVTQGARNLR